MPVRRQSITAVLLLVLLLCVALVTTRLALQHIDRMWMNAHSHAEQIARTMAQLAHFEVAANDRIALGYRLEGFTHFTEVQSVIILDRRQSLLAAAERNPAGNLVATSRRPFETSGYAADPGGQNALANMIVRADIGEIAPIGWVYVDYRMTTHAAQRLETLMQLAVAMGLLLLVAGLGWRLFQARSISSTL